MDAELKLQILRVCVRDRQFLKTSAADVNPDDFDNLEEQTIAKCALNFYEQYGDPIGPLLRSSVTEILEGTNYNKTRLRELLDNIQHQKIEIASLPALKDRVQRLKQGKFFEEAFHQIVAAKQDAKLNLAMFTSIVEKAAKVLANGYKTSEYFDAIELEKRIKRRTAAQATLRFPKIMIDPLDKKIKIIGRGMLGLVIAPYGTGKSMLLLHIAAAYAIQGLRVLFVTLEDPKEEAEDRLDSSLSGIALGLIAKAPDEVREKFLKRMEGVKGRIRIIDGTEGGFTISRIEQIWRQEKEDGFTADAVIVDYDDEIECEKPLKERRFEFAEIYRRMRRAAVNTDSIWWTASQAGRAAEGQKLVHGKDIAEDISKARKCFFALAIGTDDKDEHRKYLNVVKHKMDKSKFHVSIWSDYEIGAFYDRERTLKGQKKIKANIEAKKKKKMAVVEAAKAEIQDDNT